MSRRKKKNIKPRETYAIIVDGETEVWYLQMLKRNERHLAINIEPKLPIRKSLSDQYKMAETLATDYTKVFWVVDYDVIRKETREAQPGMETREQQFIRLRKTALAIPNVSVIVNDPCLEFWLLLHFVTTNRFFGECSSVEKQVAMNMEGYEKTRKFFTKQDQDIYLMLKDKLPEAIERAERLGPYDEYDTERAVCEMYQLFNDDSIHSVVTRG